MLVVCCVLVAVFFVCEVFGVYCWSLLCLLIVDYSMCVAGCCCCLFYFVAVVCRSLASLVVCCVRCVCWLLLFVAWC